jgi:curved DNA-binding protein CbpA
MKNYYKILDVPTNSAQADIKKAYRALAIKYHPDKNAGDSSSEERFKEISEAYIVLGDVAKRNAYDFSKGYQTSYRSREETVTGQRPATFLLLFKKVKNRVLDAGGRINHAALFKVIDDLLSNENIEFLVRCGDTATNSIIIDDILTSCNFLDNSERAVIYIKLTKLADGNAWLLNKANRLMESSFAKNRRQEARAQENPSTMSIVLFVVFVAIIVLMIII